MVFIMFFFCWFVIYDTMFTKIQPVSHSQTNLVLSKYPKPKNFTPFFSKKGAAKPCQEPKKLLPKFSSTLF